MVAIAVSLLLLLPSVLLVLAQLPSPDSKIIRDTTAAAAGGVEAVLSSASSKRSSVLLFTDATSSANNVFMLANQMAPWGVAVFEVAVDDQDANVTQAQLSRVVDEARRLRQVSWCLTVVVVSDDPAFLAAFAEWSLKGRLLVWSTRLLAVTSLPLPELHYLHKTFSLMNAMILVVENPTNALRCSLYLHLPYNPKALQVASWMPQEGRLTLTTNLTLFPDKYNKFLERPNLVAATEVNPINKMITLENPEAPGGKRLKFTGPVPNLMDYLSKALNFSYTYVRPPDGSWGFKHADGSWSGMVGMVMREKADIGVGPFGVSATRAEVVDFTGPILIDYYKILGGRGLPEVDPWGFLLPLAPLVWVAIPMALLVVPVSMWLLSSCFSVTNDEQKNTLQDIFTFIRVLLQQNIPLLEGWWWERLIFAMWMLMTLVLTRSYAGNLMSLLAVRHIPQPFQSLQDIVDDSSVVTIWEEKAASVQYLQSVDSGIFWELAELEKEDRILYKTLPQFGKAADTLVTRGDHVLMEVEMSLKAIMSQDFTRTGQCSFYRSKEEFLPLTLSMIGQKDSPLVPVLSKRIMSVREAGLFNHWMKEDEPNSSICFHAPSKITVRTSLTLNNLWGMFVVFSGGHLLSLLVLCGEILIRQISPL
ncbi:probable glutamate receptor [Homarus americanus]|uniref:probable glutamate receptor n=1 Tax=Homarus americanus TaxID=6706 RepID=UPI001C47A5C7|nr:probable glutamate receptor [Homarus americanus]